MMHQKLDDVNNLVDTEAVFGSWKSLMFEIYIYVNLIVA